MDMSSFYFLDSDFIKTDVVVSTDYKFGFWTAPINKDLELIMGNYQYIDLPLIYKYKKGRYWRDILDTGWGYIYLISERMVNIMKENGFTGWKLFDVEVYDKQNNKVPGYYGLSATGRCGSQDYSKCIDFTTKFVENGPIVEMCKGFHFDINTWDGSDFFFAKNHYGFIITECVYHAFLEAKLSNLRMSNLLDWNIQKRIVLDMMKRDAGN